METSSLSLESPQERQTVLLEELIHCLDRERQVLIDLDIPGLWTVVEEKHGILQTIEALSTKEVTKTPPSEPAPESAGIDAPAKTGADRKIDLLKEEIRERARENAAFIQDSLTFVDKLISLFAGTPSDAETYRPHGEERRPRRGPIYRREV
jgi:flagellar biosynthesis/type III secretory pathway chaperone